MNYLKHVGIISWHINISAESCWRSQRCLYYHYFGIVFLLVTDDSKISDVFFSLVCGISILYPTDLFVYRFYTKGNECLAGISRIWFIQYINWQTTSMSLASLQWLLILPEINNLWVTQGLMEEPVWFLCHMPFLPYNTSMSYEEKKGRK